MASNKIHLGNTKIVSDADAPEDTVIATPTKSGTIALLSDVGEGANPVDTYTKTEIDAQQSKQNHEIAENHAATQTNSNRITKNEEDIAALEARPIGGETVDAYTKDEVDAQQNLQDIEIAKNAEAISNIPAPINAYSKDQIDSQQQAQDDVTATKANKIDVYTKAEVDAQQTEQDTEIAKKLDSKDAFPEAPEDGETYARNNKTWVSISDTSGIPDAPVDGSMYGRRNGEWDAVADAGDIYTKAEVDASQNAQDVKIDKNITDIAKNTADIAAIPAPVDAYTKDEVDASQLAQDTEIAKKADKETTYTKAQIDSQQSAQDIKIDKNTDDIQTNADAIAAIPAPIDSYTKAEVDASQNEQDVEIAKKADKTNVYTKAEMDTQQAAQDTKIDKNVSDVAKNTADIAKYTADVAKNTSDIAENKKDIAQNTEDIAAMPPYVDAYTKTETNTLLDGKADKGTTGGDGIEEAPVDGKQYARKDGDWSEVEATSGGVGPDSPFKFYGTAAVTMVAPLDPVEGQMMFNNVEGYPDPSWGIDTDLLIPVDAVLIYELMTPGKWGVIQAPSNAPGGETIDAYTKAEVDASQKVQDDAIAELQNQNAPWEPHDYLYVNNCVKSPEEGKHWEKFVAPKPGEVFFMGPGGMPLSDDSYQFIELIYISKYDKKGNELPFKYENIYNEETGELEFVMFDVNRKPLKFASPNGSATFMMMQLITSDIAPEHIGYEGETFYIITIDMYEEGYIYKGTITEGEIAQVTSPEEGQVIAEWEAKEYESPDNPSDIISSANIKTNQIVVNKLAIGSSYSRSEEAVTNIMIGNEPDPMKPWWADDYLPGLHWNTNTSEGNIAVGHNSLRCAENVIQNVAVGSYSLQQLRNGWGNTAIGYEAGANLSNGNYNIFIGYGAGPKGENDVSGQVVLGSYEAQELWVGNNKVFPFPDDLGGGSGGDSGGGASGGIEEAPTDDKQYARQSERWTEVEAKMPEPRGNNTATWGRKNNRDALQGNDWARVKEIPQNWHNFKGEFYHGRDPAAGCISIDNLFYSSTTAVKISTTEIPGTSVSATPMKDRLKALKVGDSIDVQTTHYYKNDNHVGGGALEITGITEHDTYFEFNVNSNDKYWGALEPHDGVAVLLPGEVAPETKDVYDYNLEVNAITVNGQGVFKSHIIGSEGLNFPNLSTASSSTTPLGITAEGWIYKTATTYSAEEVDKKLAIKDKLIEKLSARLDKLEKRMKK
jgi:hypothetical protein